LELQQIFFWVVRSSFSEQYDLKILLSFQSNLQKNLNYDLNYPIILFSINFLLLIHQVSILCWNATKNKNHKEVKERKESTSESLAFIIKSFEPCIMNIGQQTEVILFKLQKISLDLFVYIKDSVVRKMKLETTNLERKKKKRMTFTCNEHMKKVSIILSHPIH
jgi:hypothetical protein